MENDCFILKISVKYISNTRTHFHISVCGITNAIFSILKKLPKLNKTYRVQNTGLNRIITILNYPDNLSVEKIRFICLEKTQSYLVVYNKCEN